MTRPSGSSRSPPSRDDCPFPSVGAGCRGLGPDTVSYGYDSAHLLTSVTGFSGNKITSCFRGPRPGARPPASGYGVIVVANASVRLLVSPLFVCTKKDLNAVPSSASP